MPSSDHSCAGHSDPHAFMFMNPRLRDGVVVHSRRSDTKLLGTPICEYLPKQAAMRDKFTLIRSVDCRFSNHEPNRVMQTANLANAPRTNPKARYYPSLGSTVGHNQWPHVMSLSLARGGFRHIQVIGASDKHGGQIDERPVTPGDLAATIYHQMGVPLDATYTAHQGRPNFNVDQGAPIIELI